jgi:hypothetical protein
VGRIFVFWWLALVATGAFFAGASGLFGTVAIAVINNAKYHHVNVSNLISGLVGAAIALLLGYVAIRAAYRIRNGARYSSKTSRRPISDFQRPLASFSGGNADADADFYKRLEEDEREKKRVRSEAEQREWRAQSDLKQALEVNQNPYDIERAAQNLTDAEYDSFRTRFL